MLGFPEVPQDVTELLMAWGSGDREALDRLVASIYGDLRFIARNCLRSERVDHTLQPSALVNEVYFRLVRQGEIRWRHRTQFYALAARLMRRILVDHARRRRAQKRSPVTLVSESWESTRRRELEALALEDALGKLEAVAPRQAKVVELRFFGGMTTAEVAEVVGVSRRTVRLDWSAARTWLYRELGRQRPTAPGEEKEDVPGRGTRGLSLGAGAR